MEVIGEDPGIDKSQEDRQYRSTPKYVWYCSMHRQVIVHSNYHTIQ